MPSTRRKTTKNGKTFYEIRVSRGRGQSYLSTRWYVPDGWSKKTIDRELKKAAAEFERQVKAGEIISRAERQERDLKARQEAERVPTLKDYAEKTFLPEKDIRCAETTRANYRFQFEKRIYPALGDKKMIDITAREINAFLLAVQKECNKSGTAIQCYQILSALFGSAFRDETVEHNPMLRIPRPTPLKSEAQKETPDAFTVEQLQEIIGLLDGEPLRWKTFTMLLIYSGMRRGEAAALTWANIDFKNNRIVIDKSVQLISGQGVIVSTPKNGHVRTVEVGEPAMALLRELRTAQVAGGLSPWCFPSPADAMLPANPNGFNAFLKRFSKKNGIEGLHPHRLRHSYATAALGAGASLLGVSNQLGHTGVEITSRVYIHDSQTAKADTRDKFTAALEPAQKKNREA